MPDQPTDDLISQAESIGTEHGKNAASWVFDGNTTNDTYAWYVRGIDAGDPEVLDSLRSPDLSGMYADDYSESDLAADLGLDPADVDGLNDAAFAYNDAASAAFWHEVERVARYHVTTQEPAS